MSGKKINPIFIVLCGAGIVIIGFSFLGTIISAAKLDEADADKSEVSLQLSAMLNFIVTGLALILAGVGFQLTAGSKTSQPPPGQGQPYGQAAQPPYQQAPPAGQQQWGRQA